MPGGDAEYHLNWGFTKSVLQPVADPFMKLRLRWYEIRGDMVKKEYRDSFYRSVSVRDESPGEGRITEA